MAPPPVNKNRRKLPPLDVLVKNVSGESQIKGNLLTSFPQFFFRLLTYLIALKLESL